MRKIRKIVFAAILILVAIITTALAMWLTATDNDKAETIEAITDALSREDEAEREIDWSSLPDSVIAWVEVPGTNIDQPIVQATPDAPNAYLYRDALGQGNYGTPYIDCDCSLTSPFVMVYGHHMSDGSAFADFANFIDEAYAREHSRIIIYQRCGETLDLEACAVDVVNANQERLVIPEDKDFKGRIGGSDLILDEDAETGKLWTFATCSYQTRNSRTIVYAVDSVSGI
ncbi:MULTISPECIES: class B sortase [Eggerthellaceae]|uniref:Sortase n=2 Tax=Eggerthellaceae TaxID=1643826 RepID=A0A5C5BX12_EGGLN|nr:class B sortase [Eggerthella lenta]MDU6848139.1 sortase [Eggerthella sp.]MCQ5103192.1 sortase [Eggerthella lenta]MDB1800934.1 sortase [Eggerthella lenta]RDB77374.1 class B sortase [Eggerthella lenta]TNU91285.1 sortase [Eggerthella lenta]